MTDQTSRKHVVVWLLIAVLGIIGLALVVGGVILVSKGGSPYYVLAGIAVLVSALGLVRQRAYAMVVYGALLIVTIVWGLWEVGLDGWALAPRLIAPAVLGLVFLLPAVSRASALSSRWWVGGPIIATVGLFVACVVVADKEYGDLKPATVIQASDPEHGEWRHWGRALTGQRNSPLSQINVGNVSKLKLAWDYKSDVAVHGGDAGSMETTPLAVDDKLYTCLDRNVIVALDQEDGHEIWRFDPKTNLAGVYSATCRGVAYYEAPQPIPECQKRVLFGTNDARLMAVDAETGKLCTSFGDNGTADLKIGMGQMNPGDAYPTSPPTVVNGVAAIGQWVLDGMNRHMPSGVVRGYDAVTGQLRWAWDIGHPDRTGLPPEGETYTRATPNAWGVFSADESLGLLYIGTGNSTPDYYGAQRSPESEKYSSAVVAIDVATGKSKWVFQTVHHDLWDYDVMAQPVLVDLDSPEGNIPALIASTKRGQFFIIDRRDGHSLDGTVEKPVPQGAAPGDWVSKTQPFPTNGFPSVAGPDFREADMWGLTPIDQMLCRIKFKGARYEGLFTPPSLNYTILNPGSAGGSNWGAVTIDPDRKLLVANTLYAADYTRLLPRAEADALKAPPAKGGKDSAVPESMRTSHGSQYAYLQPQEETPYAIWRSVFISPLDALCQRPPYARLSVFDLNTHKLVWSKPLGTAEHLGPFGMESHLPIRIGAPGIGGSITTAGGLIFIGANQDRHFRAFDVANGEELWRFDLPAPAGATPMTYVSKKSGKQFVVISASGHPALKGPHEGHIMAFAIPSN
jgi:membrane-bound PQQ-dependent dehydrogenase (glucose/quinate/shikimate family)